MSEEQRRVLDMVQAGVITAAEAERLLNALEQSGAGGATTDAAPAERVSGMVVTTPDNRGYRRYWEVPVAAGALLLAASGICLLWAGSAGLFLIGMICLWGVFLLSGLIALIGWWSRSAPWLHIRIDEQDGDRLAFSLPLPLGLAEAGLRVARRFTDADTRANLDLAASLVSMARG